MHLDAGVGLRYYVIRVVASMANGQRLVATTRTKNAGYTESVDVEVVQVTATVTDSQMPSWPDPDKFRIKEDGVPQRLTAFSGRIFRSNLSWPWTSATA